MIYSRRLLPPVSFVKLDQGARALSHSLWKIHVYQCPFHHIGARWFSLPGHAARQKPLRTMYHLGYLSLLALPSPHHLRNTGHVCAS